MSSVDALYKSPKSKEDEEDEDESFLSRYKLPLALGGSALGSYAVGKAMFDDATQNSLKGTLNSFNNLREEYGKSLNADDAIRAYAEHGKSLVDTKAFGVNFVDATKFVRENIVSGHPWRGKMDDQHYGIFKRGPAFSGSKLLASAFEGKEGYGVDDYTKDLTGWLGGKADQAGLPHVVDNVKDFGDYFHKLHKGKSSLLDSQQSDFLKSITSGDLPGGEFGKSLAESKNKIADTLVHDYAPNYLKPMDGLTKARDMLTGNIPLILGGAAGGTLLYKLLSKRKKKKGVKPIKKYANTAPVDGYTDYNGPDLPTLTVSGDGANVGGWGSELFGLKGFADKVKALREGQTDWTDGVTTALGDDSISKLKDTHAELSKLNDLQKLLGRISASTNNTPGSIAAVGGAGLGLIGLGIGGLGYGAYKAYKGLTDDDEDEDQQHKQANNNNMNTLKQFALPVGHDKQAAAMFRAGAKLLGNLGKAGTKVPGMSSVGRYGAGAGKIMGAPSKAYNAGQLAKTWGKRLAIPVGVGAGAYAINRGQAAGVNGTSGAEAAGRKIIPNAETRYGGLLKP